MQKHFGKTLADDKVQILDSATATGTFITNLINQLPLERLVGKYRHEIHANEVAILPYYIANLNIESTYRERTGRYLEFRNLCFVDTLDNMDWQPRGATGGAVTRQGAFNLGALSEENWIRVQEQNEKPISVITGNPPYNDSAALWGDGGANREYAGIDGGSAKPTCRKGRAAETDRIESLKEVFDGLGYEQCDDGRAEGGCQKVALYEENGEMKHAAMQMPNGRWRSKLGQGPVMEHHSPQSLSGGMYGDATVYMGRAASVTQARGT